MILLTPELRFALRANDLARGAAARDDRPEPDPVPVVKFFNPLGAATWLATELFDDGDSCFGLADLGFGSPELGVFSLSAMASIRLPFGMGIERDVAFATTHRLSTWAEWARRAGSILWAEQLLGSGDAQHRGTAAEDERLLRRAASPPGDDELPPSGG